MNTPIFPKCMICKEPAMTKVYGDIYTGNTFLGFVCFKDECRKNTDDICHHYESISMEEIGWNTL